eukprot:487049-Rhodomonas_salina.1
MKQEDRMAIPVFLKPQRHRSARKRRPAGFTRGRDMQEEATIQTVNPLFKLWITGHTVIKDLQKHLRLSQASRPKTGPGSRNGSKYNSDEDDEDDDDENIPDETPTASFARDMNLSEEEDEDDAPSVTEEVKKSRAKWLESIDDVCIYGNDSRASTDESDADIEEQLDTVEVPDLDSHFVNLSSSPPGPTVPPPSPTNKPVRGGVGTNKAPASTIRRSRYSEVIRRSREQRTTGIQSSPRNGKALFGRSPRSISPGKRR